MYGFFSATSSQFQRIPSYVPLLQRPGTPIHNVWLKEEHPDAFCLHLERADGGRQVCTLLARPYWSDTCCARSLAPVQSLPVFAFTAAQDLDYDAAVPMYIDRKYFVEYLHTRVFAPKHSNILEDFLYVTLRSTQYVAMTRANAIIDIRVSRPMRWLSGNSASLTDWSPFSMGRVVDIVEQFFVQAQHDGSLFLDPALDLFQAIAAEQPLFAEWRTYTFTQDFVYSPGNSVKHLVYKLALAEALQPVDATNAATRAKTNRPSSTWRFSALPRCASCTTPSWRCGTNSQVR